MDEWKIYIMHIMSRKRVPRTDDEKKSLNPCSSQQIVTLREKFDELSRVKKDTMFLNIIMSFISQQPI